MNSAPTISTLTSTYLKYGIIPVGEKNSLQMGLPAPLNSGSVKVEVFFDDGEEKSALLYDPSNKRFFGGTKWFKEHDAVPNDKVSIETVTPEQCYRFRFIAQHPQKPSRKQKTTPPATTSSKKGRGESVVGDLLDYRNLVYGPVNEQGVVLIFGMVFKELGMLVEEVKTGFPDATIRRYNGKGWVREKVEFEYCSSNFKLHKHPVEGCDIIICWKHDWKECPLEVIDLAEYIQFSPAVNQNIGTL